MGTESCKKVIEKHKYKSTATMLIDLNIGVQREPSVMSISPSKTFSTKYPKPSWIKEADVLATVKGYFIRQPGLLIPRF